MTRAGLTDLAPGAVVTYPDEKLSFPHNLFRRPHARRFGVVVSNARLCAERSTSIIVIVPMTSEVQTLDMTEVVIKKSAENGLERDSSAMLHLIQPALKTSVIEKVGTLNAADWEALVAGLAWMVERE